MVYKYVLRQCMLAFYCPDLPLLAILDPVEF